MHRAQSGVTLIELLVTVAILGIIIGIAVPAYQDHIKTGEAGAMRQKMDSLRVFEENYHVENGTFFPGVYRSGGVNPFEAIGFRIANDDDGIDLEVTTCDTRPITSCYKVEARMPSAKHAVVWMDGKYSAYDMP